MLKYSSFVSALDLHHFVSFPEKPRKFSTHVSNGSLNTCIMIRVVHEPHFAIVVVEYLQNAASEKAGGVGISFVDNSNCFRGNSWMSCE